MSIRVIGMGMEEQSRRHKKAARTFAAAVAEEMVGGTGLEPVTSSV
jgi:hypothetical protein